MRNTVVAATHRDTILIIIQVPVGNSDTEEMTIEVIERWGIHSPLLLPIVLLASRRIVIPFSTNTRASFDSIGRYMNARAKVDPRHCPLILAGMQTEQGPLVVIEEEAANRAAELVAGAF